MLALVGRERGLQGSQLLRWLPQNFSFAWICFEELFWGFVYLLISMFYPRHAVTTLLPQLQDTVTVGNLAP